MYFIFLSYDEQDFSTHTQFTHSRERGTIHGKEDHGGGSKVQKRMREM